MSEVQARPSATRGRGSAMRAGRGGFSSRGGGRFGARQSNGEASSLEPVASFEEQGELGQLKKQYMSDLSTLKDMFSDWTDDDLVFALQETNGDLQSTILRITEGSVSRFADVKKKTKEKKAKDFQGGSTESQTTSTRGRGGRGGFEGGRGGRGRGIERGRGSGRGGRGGSGAAASGRAIVSTTTTTESPSWEPAQETTTASSGWEQQSSAANVDVPIEGSWASVTTSDITPAAASEGQKSSLIPQGATKSWASIMAQKPAPNIPKTQTTAATEQGPVSHEEAQVEQQHDDQNVEEEEAIPPIPIADALPSADDMLASEDTAQDSTYPDEAEAAVELTPSKDKLTEDNVEHLPDTSFSAPVPETAASTVDGGSAFGTPFTTIQPLAVPRPPMGGYAASAWKATGTPGRTASFQRIMEQREAVVMPSNHAVDRAAVQFGSMGLNGESNPLDIDEDREDAETRAQPPQQSPPSQPRASLPPAPQQQQSVASEQPLQESLPTPKPAPGLPPVSQLSSTSIPTQHMPQTSAESQSQGSQQYGQYSRYGAGSLTQDHSAPPQKPYDPFSQQLNYPQSHQDTQGGYPSQSQAPGHGQQPGQGFAQGQGEYGSQQYGTEQQRNAFQSYYSGSYGQQGNANVQENMPPQRSASGFGGHESGYGSSQGPQNQSRYGETQTSGNNTPAPTTATQQQPGTQSQQGQQMHQQSQGQSGHGGSYPYTNPYSYNGSYYNNYVNQQYPSYNYNQQGYGAPFGGKGGMYGQPHHAYGMSPQTSYEHSSSTPGATGGLGGTSSQGRDSAFSGGLGDYGRSASTQQSQNQQHHSSYGSFPGEQQESFGRSPSGMNPYGGPQGEGSLKPFQDQKPGASPSLAQPGRAGSAANSTGYGGNQSNFAPPQSQQGFGGYPSHLQHTNHGSQYGGIGGLGGGHQGNAQSHQGGGGYGGYGAGGFGSNYGNYGGRGGWGNSYNNH